MFKMKQIITGAAFALITGFATISGSVIASTPDGETPANEGVCNELIGATPGLYGLCVAYCEAQDLDTTNKKPPSLRILANYNKKKQDGDLDMPCTSPNYGCFNEDELNSIITTNLCISFDDHMGAGSYVQYGIETTELNHYVKVDTRPEANCSYADARVEGSNVFRFHEFENTTQAQAAYDAVKAKCALITP